MKRKKDESHSAEDREDEKEDAEPCAPAAAGSLESSFYTESRAWKLWTVENKKKRQRSRRQVPAAMKLF